MTQFCHIFWPSHLVEVNGAVPVHVVHSEGPGQLLLGAAVTGGVQSQHELSEIKKVGFMFYLSKLNICILYAAMIHSYVTRLFTWNLWCHCCLYQMFWRCFCWSCLRYRLGRSLTNEMRIFSVWNNICILYVMDNEITVLREKRRLWILPWSTFHRTGPCWAHRRDSLPGNPHTSSETQHAVTGLWVKMQKISWKPCTRQTHTHRAHVWADINFLYRIIGELSHTHYIDIYFLSTSMDAWSSWVLVCR